MKKYLHGFGFVANFLFLFYIIPWSFGKLFDLGLEGTNLWIVIGCVPFVILTFFIQRFPVKMLNIIRNVGSWILGALLFFVALLVEFEINSNNLMAFIVFDFMFVVGFYVTIIDLLSAYPEKADQSPTILIISAILAVIGLLWIGFPSDYFIFYPVGVLFLMKPFFNRFRDAQGIDSYSFGAFPQKLGNFIIFLFIIICAFLTAPQLVTSILILESKAMGYALIGAAVALSSTIIKNLNIRPMKLFMLFTTLIYSYIIYFIDYEFILTWWGNLILGLPLGFSAAIIYEHFTVKSGTSRCEIFDLRGFFIIALSIVMGLLGFELKFLMRNLSEYLWIFPVAMIGLGLLAGLSIFIGGRLIQRPSSLPAEKLQTKKRSERKHNINAKKIAAMCLLFVLLTPLFAIIIRENSKAYVRINLDTTMYTVNGEPVNVIDIKAKTAKIVLYDPKPEGFSHNESIRLNKTVRLGAYLYDTPEDISPKDCREYIASNLDVYALGGYLEGYFWPEDFQAMRNINNDTRIYIMTFATTLGEHDNWTVDGSLEPYTHWNSTMDGWTLKTNDGTEALGVRRGSHDSLAHLMDLGSMEWADYYAMIYDNRVEAYHADGVAIDEVMWEGYWGTDINNLRDYDSIAEIEETCYEWLERVQQKSDIEIITQAFWDEAQQYQDGIWGEIAFRSGGAYGNRVDDRSTDVFYKDMDWKGIVDNLVKHGESNDSYIWAAWYKQNDMEALEYSIATYLMGKINDCRSVGFHPQPIIGWGYPYSLCGYDVRNVMSEVEKHPEYYDLELGDALGPMELVNGDGGQVWKREFTNGIVYVNPFHAYVPGFDSTAVANPSH